MRNSMIGHAMITQTMTVTGRLTSVMMVEEIPDAVTHGMRLKKISLLHVQMELIMISTVQPISQRIVAAQPLEIFQSATIALFVTMGRIMTMTVQRISAQISLMEEIAAACILSILMIISGAIFGMILQNAQVPQMITTMSSHLAIMPSMMIVIR